MKERKSEIPMPVVPRDYTRAPFFAATQQNGSREIVVGNRRYIIGGFHPLDPSYKVPALDIRHGRACFTLLSFRKLPFGNQLVRFSMNEFCKRYSGTNSGVYSRHIRKLLRDLTECYIKVIYPDNTSLSYRLIERVKVLQKPRRKPPAKEHADEEQEIWLEEVYLSEEFNSLFNELTELTQIRIDVLNRLTSPLSQTIYSFLPSRSHHHTKEHPFEITLTNLLQQVSHPVPKHKSKRKQLFTQNRLPIITQLDNKPTLTGILRVKLTETANKKDFKLCSWVEKPSQPEVTAGDSKLLEAWRKSGRSESEFRQRTTQLETLSAYERDLLEHGAIEVEGNERFLQIAKTLLGASRFGSLLGEAKNEIIERNPARKNPTARLFYRLVNAVENSGP